MNDTKNDMSRNDAAERDQARHTLSAEETSVIFADAGVPRSVRTVQRYCKKGPLACITIDTGKVRYVLRDFPLTNIYAEAVIAAQAAHCAGEMDQYWTMHDRYHDGQLHRFRDPRRGPAV